MGRDASILREILARECETVNHYEALAATAESESVRELVLHLALEEKEHISECARLLAQVDADYAALLAKPLSHALTPQAPAAPLAAPPGPAAARSPTHRFTIGSLIAPRGGDPNRR